MELDLKPGLLLHQRRQRTHAISGGSVEEHFRDRKVDD